MYQSSVLCHTLPRLDCLKQHPFISSQPCRSEVQAPGAWLGFLRRVTHSRCCPAALPDEARGGECTSRLIQIVGRIKLLTDGILRTCLLAGYLPLPGAHPQPHSPCQAGPLLYESAVETLSSSPSHALKSLISFKGSPDYVRPTQVMSL